MLESSFTGMLRTVFIIIGVITVLRILGRVLKAKREQQELRDLESREEAVKKAKAKSGRIDILKTSDSKSSRNAEDVDFKEIND